MTTQRIGCQSLANRYQNVRPELLLEFVKALVQEVQNSDSIILALHRAKRKSGASEEETELLTEAVFTEMKKYNPYPEGFMP